MPIDEVIEHWGAVATAIAAMGGLAYGLWRYILVPTIDLFKGIAIFMTEALPVLTTVAKEFQPNGGSSLRDVIDRIEVKLAHNYNVATVLLQESPDAVFVTDGKGNCTWVNDTYTRWTGIGIDGALGRGWHSAIAMKDRQLVYDEWEDAVNSKSNFTGQYWWTDGVHEFPVRCRTKLTIDAKGRLAGAIGIVKRLDLPDPACADPLRCLPQETRENLLGLHK